MLAIGGNPLLAQDPSLAGYHPFREIVHEAVAVTAALGALIA